MAAARPFLFMTNHAHVLLAITAQPDVRGRTIATALGITERAVQQIIKDLAEAGFLEITRVGRRNVHRINPDAPLRAPAFQQRRVGDVLAAVLDEETVARAARGPDTDVAGGARPSDFLPKSPRAAKRNTSTPRRAAEPKRKPR